jgi:hypothetical protein
LDELTPVVPAEVQAEMAAPTLLSPQVAAPVHPAEMAESVAIPAVVAR